MRWLRSPTASDANHIYGLQGQLCFGLISRQLEVHGRGHHLTVLDDTCGNLVMLSQAATTDDWI